MTENTEDPRLNTLTNLIGKEKSAIQVLKNDYKSKKATLIKMLEKNNLTKYNNEIFNVHMTKASTYKSFSTAKLRKIEPQTYKDPKFQTIRHRRAYLRINKDNK